MSQFINMRPKFMQKQNYIASEREEKSEHNLNMFCFLFPYTVHSQHHFVCLYVNKIAITTAGLFYDWMQERYYPEVFIQILVSIHFTSFGEQERSILTPHNARRHSVWAGFEPDPASTHTPVPGSTNVLWTPTFIKITRWVECILL